MGKVSFTVKIASLVAAASALAVGVSGCFMIPLMDGRSPFDSAGGASNRQINEAIPMLQAQLDQFNSDSDWVVVASRAADNCEGDCDLRLAVNFEPSQELFLSQIDQNMLPAENTFVDLQVPADLWRQVAAASIAFAGSKRLNVELDAAGWGLDKVTFRGIEYTPYPSTCDAVVQYLGVSLDTTTYVPGQYRNRIFNDENPRCTTMFYSASNPTLTSELGLE